MNSVRSPKVLLHILPVLILAAAASYLPPRAAASPGQTITITPNPTLPAAIIGQPYSLQLQASGGTPPYTWTSEGLPDGITLSSTTGQLTSTSVPVPPLGTNYFVLTVSVSDSTPEVPNTVAPNLILPAAPAPVITINPATLPPAEVNQPYSYTFSATGGSNISWSLQGNPSWLSIGSSSGVLAGTPPSTSPVSFTVIAASGEASSGLPVGLTVYPALAIGPGSLPPGVVNAPYSQQVSLSGGTGQGYSLTASGLPPGLRVSSAGLISGTPTSAGTFGVTATLKDSAGYSVTGNLSMVINPAVAAVAITTSSLPAATAAALYSQQLGASGGTGGYIWSGSGLPSWLSLSSSGVLSGTPPTGGSFPFSVTVKDSAGNSASASFTLQVNTSLQITTTSLPDGSLGATYSASLVATGAIGNVAWSVISGALPANLSLASTGSISGTATVTGNFAFTIQAVDSSGAKATANLTIHIPQPPNSSITATLSSVLTPASQPAVNISISPAYPLPIDFTASIAISPDISTSTDLGFSNGSRNIQFTAPANTSEYQLPFSTGTSAGTITITLTVTTTGQSLTVSGPIVLTAQVALAPPSLTNVTATAAGSTVTVVVTGYSVTRDMKTAQFHFTPAAGAALTSSDFTIDVSSLFATWYTNTASFATGSQFKLTAPFNIAGSTSAISSVTATMTNSNGTSAPVTANLK